MALAAIVRRIRSFSLSIGQLTFASFILLLAMIVITSVASVVSIRHIDATFAELQHLQSIGDVAEEIDRRCEPIGKNQNVLLERRKTRLGRSAGNRITMLFAMT